MNSVYHYLGSFTPFTLETFVDGDMAQPDLVGFNLNYALVPC